MSTEVKRRRGTTAQHATFTGAEGEWTQDTDKNTAVVHDGVTPGGHPLAKASDVTPVAAQIIAADAKSAPDDADLVGLADSADSNALKKLSWANVKASIWTALGALINGGTAKTTPIDGDMLAIADSADSNASKKLTWANVKAGIWSALGALIAGGTVKTTLVAADRVAISDSEAADASKYATVGSIWGTLTETQTVSSSTAGLNFVLPDGFSDFVLIVDNLRPVTDDIEMALRVSIDGGANFLQGASDYEYMMLASSVAGDNKEGNAATSYLPFNLGASGWGIGNDTGEIHSYRIHIHRPGGATGLKFITCDCYFKTIAGGVAVTTMRGYAKGSAASNPVNAIRFLGIGGNIAQCTARLFGIR